MARKVQGKKTKKTTTKAVVRRPNARRTEKYNWTAARQWYMLANLNRGDDEPEVMLKDAAERLGIPKNTLYMRAKKQGWRAQMQLARNAQDDMGMKKVIDFSAMNQAETRAEFAELGKLMARKARLRIATQDPTDIPLAEANSMVTRAQQVVAKSQGWPEKFVFDVHEGQVETAAANIAETASVEKLAAMFLEFLTKRKKERDEAIDGDCEPVQP